MPAPAAPVAKTPQQVIEEFLALQSIERRDEHLKTLSELPEGLEAVTVLDLSRSGVTDTGMSYLPKFPALDEIDLSETRISNSGMTAVGQVPTLRKIVLRAVQQVDNTGIQALTKLEKLEELTLATLPISDGVMESIKEMKGLRRLNISGNRTLLGMEFSNLVSKGHFESLEELNVSQTQFGFYGLKQMNKLKNLQILVAMQCEIADGLVTGLGGCESLRILNVGQNKLTDEGIKGINRMKKLEELNLSGNLITDKAVVQFKTMKQLKSLNLDATGVTAAEAGELKTKSLTDTVIIAEGKTL